AGGRVLEGALHVVEGLGEHDGAAVDLGVEPGPAGELGEAVCGQVDLDRAAAGLPALDVGHEVAPQLGPVDLLQEGDPGVGGVHHHLGGELLAALQDDPGGPAARARDLPDRGRGADLGAEAAGGGGPRAGG